MTREYRNPYNYRNGATYRGSASSSSTAETWRGGQQWRGPQTWAGVAPASVAPIGTWRGSQLWRGPQTWRGGVLAPGFDPSNSVVGWNLGVLDAGATADRFAQIDRVDASGAKIVRVDAYWPSLQPTNAASATAGNNDTFDATALANLDAFVGDAAGRGIKVWLSAAYTPAWARDFIESPDDLGYGQGDHIPPTRGAAQDYPDYANFVLLITARYEQLYPGTVVAVGVWNEPNIKNFWMQPPGTGTTGASWSPDAVEYAHLLRGAHAAIKSGVVQGRGVRAAHPNVYVTAGATAPAGGNGATDNYSPVNFVATFMASGGQHAFDHLDHHPYSWQFGPNFIADWNSFQQIHDLWAVLQFFSRTDAYIWCSEIGGISRPDVSGTDTNSPWGVGGYDALSAGSPGGSEYLTSQRAINYTLFDQRVEETFTAWRSAQFYDATINRQITGVMVWYELHDKSGGINTDWPDASDEGFYGFYEYGTTRFNGPAKGNALHTWRSFVDPDVTAPTVTILSPSVGQTVSGIVAVAASVVDDRDPIVANVQLLVDDVTVGTMSWFFVHGIEINTNAYGDGTHYLRVRAQDSAGNITISDPYPFIVDSSTVVIGSVDPEAWDPHSAWRIFARDGSFQRMAEVSPAAVVKIVARLNDVWSFTVECPFNDVCVEHLMQPQAGIEVRVGSVLVMGGVVTGFSRKWNANESSVIFAGVSDLAFVGNRVAHPDPLNADLEVLTQADDFHQGMTSSVIWNLVRRNIGEDAVVSRAMPGWVTAPEPVPAIGVYHEGRRARMQNLLDYINEIADYGGVVFNAAGSALVGGITFTMRAPRQLLYDVRFSPELGNLDAFEYNVEAPAMNAAYVGDDGEGISRTFAVREDATSISSWGRVEGFVNASASAVAELYELGDQSLREGAARTELKVSPLELAQSKHWPIDYDLGDIITVVVDSVTTSAEVVEVRLDRDASGVTVTPSVGAAFADVDDVYAIGRSLSRRIRDLERR